MPSAVIPLPDFTLVIPVFNEEAVLPLLFRRLYPAMEQLGRPWEVIFVDDGSRDGSVTLLRQQHQLTPQVTRVVLLRINCGQHNAIIAGFTQARGRYVITLDADLQNPPEEVGKLLVALDQGHDYVGTIRRRRQDVAWRRWASWAINRLRERITAIRMTDHGCMLRGYHRSVVADILTAKESFIFIPALAYLFAGNATEILVGHEERAAGDSKYSLGKLIRLNFDLMTGFSNTPLQLFSFVGIGTALASLVFVFYMVWRRLVVGPEAEGVFTLFAILFFLVGITLFGIGLLGEYVGRIYQQTQARPRFLVREILDNTQPGDQP